MVLGKRNDRRSKIVHFDVTYETIKDLSFRTKEHDRGDKIKMSTENTKHAGDTSLCKAHKFWLSQQVEISVKALGRIWQKTPIKERKWYIKEARMLKQKIWCQMGVGIQFVDKTTTRSYTEIYKLALESNEAR